VIVVIEGKRHTRDNLVQDRQELAGAADAAGQSNQTKESIMPRKEAGHYQGCSSVTPITRGMPV
jgi:hypothetical protein